MLCDLDLEDITFIQGQDTLLGHGQYFCEISSESEMTVVSYGSDKEFNCVCTVTLILQILPWIKVFCKIP